MILSTLFQEHVSYFTVYMMMLQDATISEQEMRIGVLESSILEKPKQLVVDEVVLTIIYLLCVIYDSPTCFNYKVPYKSICTNRHTGTNETFRSERSKDDITTYLSQWRVDNNEVVCYIKHNLLGDALGEDGSLGDIKLHPCIFFEYTL